MKIIQDLSALENNALFVKHCKLAARIEMFSSLFTLLMFILSGVAALYMIENIPYTIKALPVILYAAIMIPVLLATMISTQYIHRSLSQSAHEIMKTDKIKVLVRPIYKMDKLSNIICVKDLQ